MNKTAAFASIALAGALVATGASAHGSQGHGHTSGTVYAPTYGTTYGTTYAAPTIDLGPIEYVQPSSTVQYVQPTTTWIQPATTTTYSYTSPTYTTPTYTTPAYTAPVYTAQPPAFGTYSTPNAVRYGFDATDRVRRRLDRQQSRIRAALDRGELRGGERRRLRRNMRDIREQFRAYKAYDGIIDQNEFAALTAQLDEQSRRIRRLATNHRTAGPLASPYGPYRR